MFLLIFCHCFLLTLISLLNQLFLIYNDCVFLDDNFSFIWGKYFGRTVGTQSLCICTASLTTCTSQEMTYISKEKAVVKTYSDYICHEFLHGQYVLWILLQLFFHTDDSYELVFVKQTQSHKFPFQSLILAQSVNLNSSLKKLDDKIRLSQKAV